MKRLHELEELLGQAASEDRVDRELPKRFRTLYAELDEPERCALFLWMVVELELTRPTIEGAFEELLTITEDADGDWFRRLGDLRKTLASPRRQALRSLGDTPGGIEFLVQLRADVLEAQRDGCENLDPLDDDLARLLDSWFRRGFLYLQEIDQHSPFQQIRFLKERELVHPMVSLEEMGQRLGDDRCCFALYHAAMPDEPVVFIEAALTRGLVRSIHEIIEPGHENQEGGSPNTAIFYSINNTQDGLAGLGLGKVLIARVTESLRNRHGSLVRFATLSPIPGFWSRYLRPILEGTVTSFRLSRSGLLDQFSNRAEQAIMKRLGEKSDRSIEDLGHGLLSILSRRDWLEDPVYRRYLKRPLTAIGYTYLAEETTRHGRPLDPVARFHLGNGATLSSRNVNFAANTSDRGLEESCGLMANYIYSRSTFQQVSHSLRSLLAREGTVR